MPEADPIEAALLNRVQVEVPVVAAPFAELGRKIGATEEQVIERLRFLKSTGTAASVPAN
ncbi:MAG TPA: hypothetical protein VLZ12_04675 [Verrucomicrobiae bacterium]|nr:hypothetical protein [Verrucomicrobiae bacterium]